MPDRMWRKSQIQRKHSRIEGIKKVLGLPVIPVRIEGFDIAQLSGKYPVASLVSFLKVFRIKKITGNFILKHLMEQLMIMKLSGK